MREVYWIIGTKARRLLAALAAFIAYIALLDLDLTHTSKQLPLLWLHFGFSAPVALSFLAIGSLVWLYGSDRRVALPLFCFSCAMMIAFALETAAVSNDPLLTAVADISAALALTCCAWLLLLFPGNYFRLTTSPPSTTVQRAWTRHALLPYGYLGLVILLCGGAVANFILTYIWKMSSPVLSLIDMIYNIFVLAGILFTITISYRKLSSLREKQQLRILVGGVVIAFMPLLLLTALPSILGLPPAYVVDGQLSSLTMGLLPFALGYSILRYQILVFDTYIRRAVAWAVGTVCLAILAYFIIVFCTTVFAGNISMYAVGIAVVAVVVAPCVWWLARTLTERLFFSEILHYRRLIEKPSLVVDETLDLAEASRLIELAVLHAFETQQACLFVLDESAGCYRLCPELGEAAGDVQRRSLLDILHTTIDAEEFEGEDCLGMQSSVVERLAAAHRPLLPYEALRTSENVPVGLSRYLTTEPCRHKMLLAPVRAQGKVIGVLVIGERGDHQQYAGPDFEIVQIILSRFSPVLETARLYARASQQAALLNKLYRAGTILESTFQSIEEVASLYAAVAAGAVQAGAEIWLYDGEESALRRVAVSGVGPRMAEADSIQVAREPDWSSWFYEGPDANAWNGPSADAPSFLPQAPSFPFAWLPLSGSERQIGALALTYPRSHFFMKEEMHVLEMFAGQCAAALENARITLELRAAYERQQELDRLKDQFIVTASHELRTPLTAVQGYIELLNEYNTSLSVDVRTDFIAKARRGCDELTLLVGNIMDASRIHIDTEQINLRPVVLAEAVKHVVEILEAIIRREGRSVALAIPPDMQVMADMMRLRQIMLNLVSNAIKYSRPGTAVEIGARDNGEQVTIYVRDYGAGVAPVDHRRLFERFVRLERDMNSPVRGAGLGLYICKQLVEAMGGRIWVESSGIAGEGSVFAFTLHAVERDREPGDLEERASMSS